jgi:transposase-like protein
MSVGAHPEVVDYIGLSSFPLVSVADEIATLYRSGASIIAIARQFGKAKGTIRRNLLQNGISLRPAPGSPQFKKLRKKDRPATNPPYGFLLLKGKLVQHPAELEVVREIIDLWKTGLGPHHIAQRLNARGYKTKKQKKWAHAQVTNILAKIREYPYSEAKL